MWIVRILLLVVLLALRVPTLRVTLVLCAAAVIKSYAGEFVRVLPLGEWEHSIFTWLLFLSLVGVCGKVIKAVLEEDVGVSFKSEQDHGSETLQTPEAGILERVLERILKGVL